MNIVIATGIYPPESGGPATFVRDLAARMIADGDVVRIVTYGDERTDRSLGVETVVERSGPVVIRYLRYAWNLWKVSRQADLIFAQGPLSEGVPARLVAALRRKPFAVKVVGDVAWESAQRGGYTADLDQFLLESTHGKTTLIRWLQGLVARTSNRVITPSKYLQTVVVKWGVHEQKTVVIYNAVQRHEPLYSVGELDARYGLAGKRVLLAGGRLVPWKNIGFLIELLSTRPVSEVLVVVGTGPAQEVWNQKITALGLGSRVIWAGALSASELASWYERADAFLLPSLYEGLSHMLLEAAIHGVPTLASPAGGNAEGAALFPEQVRIEPLERRAWSAALEEVLQAKRTRPVVVWSKLRQYQAYRALLEAVGLHSRS
jgi:glycosyltransferase involved in cell wall biosynthesis